MAGSVVRIEIASGYMILTRRRHETTQRLKRNSRERGLKVRSKLLPRGSAERLSSLGRNFGQKLWLGNGRLVSTILSSQQQLVDFMLKHQLAHRYVRFDEQPSPEQISDLGSDLATENRRQTLLGMADDCYQALSNNPRVLEMLKHEPPKAIFYTEIFLGGQHAKKRRYFSDGTGQAGGFRFDEKRSNIYKLYRATRCGPDSSIDPREQVAFYDPGLGSQADGDHLFSRLLRWIHNTVAQATGFGITRNVIDCYAALIQLWHRAIAPAADGIPRSAL